MFALDEAFTARHGARESVQKIMIVITDGRAQDNVELGDYGVQYKALFMELHTKVHSSGTRLE